MATFTGQKAKNNTFTGTAAADTFRWAAADLDRLDRASGAGGVDVLQLTTGGLLAGTALTGITGIEQIALSKAGNGLTLLNANFAGVAGARIVITGGAGNDTVDGSKLTGTSRIDVTAGLGTDVLKGGAGADVFRFTAAGLTGSDQVSGGGGRDVLAFLTGGGPVAGALAKVTGVETIQLSKAGNTIALTNANFTSVLDNRITVLGGAGSDTVNASKLTGKNAIDATAGAGLDVLRGGAGNDVFRFAHGNLFADTVAGGLGSDKLVLTTAGGLVGGGLAKVSGVETFQLAKGGSGLSFTSANFTGVTGAKITVIGGAGNDTVDGSLVGAGKAFLFSTGGGLDTVIGGAGEDVFRFAAKDLAGDTVQGGKGGDLLQLTTAGALGKTALDQMNGVETITLAKGGNAITLKNGNFGGVLGGVLRVYGGAGDDTVDGSGVTGTRKLLLVGGAGKDVLTGCAGSDLFAFNRADLDGDTLVGGGGLDTLSLATAGALKAGALANMRGIESIGLASGGNGLKLVDANFIGVTGAKITVIAGAGNDSVDASQVTGKRAIDVTAGGGTDTLKGGAGDDVFQLLPTELTAGDTIAGGAGYDTLQIMRPLNLADGTLATDALAHMTGIDRIQLAKTGTGLTLTDANYAVPVTGDVPGSDRIDIYGTTGASVIDAADLTGTHAIYFYDGNGTDAVFGGEGDDVVRYQATAKAKPGDTFDGGGGNDAILFEHSMDFLGDTITNVEKLIYFNTTNSDVAVTISGENAARIGQIGSNFLDGKSAVFTVQLAAGSTTDLTNVMLVQADAGDAINVVSSGGATRVFLSASIRSFTGSSDSDHVFDYNTGGAQAIATGGGADTIFYVDGFVHEAGDAVDGGTGDDTVVVDRSMDFLGNSLVNVERLALLVGAGQLTLRISGESAAGLTHVGSASGLTEIYSIELSAGSATDLSNITLDSPDAGDAIKVVATSGNTAVTLNNQIASFTGSADSDTVGYAEGGGYKNGAVIDGGGGDDRIVATRSGTFTIDGGTGNDTLVLLGGTAVSLNRVDDQMSAAFDRFVTNFENVDASAAGAPVGLNGRDDFASVLIGGVGADTIIAGAAGATITGGLGADTLTGSIGDDRFHISSNAEAAGDTIDGKGGDDGIDVQGNADLTGAAINSIETLFLAATDAGGTPTTDDLTATVTGAQAAALTSIFGNGYNTTSVETLVVKTTGTDPSVDRTLDLSNLQFSYFDGPDHVEIFGATGNDTIIGTGANDVIDGMFASEADTLFGAGGNDIIEYRVGHMGAIDGGTGTDTIRFKSDDFSFDRIVIDLANQVSEEFRNGTRRRGDVAKNFENVDSGNSLLKVDMIGNTGDNILIGGSAVNTITGGLGADTLTGGAGADRFVWNNRTEGGDRITDFVYGSDKLVFSAAQFQFTGASFDTAIVDDSNDPGRNFTNADLILTFSSVRDATQAETFVQRLFNPPSGPIFLIGRGSNFNATLYYVDFGGVAYQIADLGSDSPIDFTLRDFVFI